MNIIKEVSGEPVIKKAKKAMHKWGARKYAEIPSESKDGVKYNVIKVREKSKRGNNYVYRCSCPKNFFNPSFKCKHIKRFIELEK